MLVYADESMRVSPEEADVGPWVTEMVGRGVNLMGSRPCTRWRGSGPSS